MLLAQAGTDMDLVLEWEAKEDGEVMVDQADREVKVGMEMATGPKMAVEKADGASTKVKMDTTALDPLALAPMAW